MSSSKHGIVTIFVVLGLVGLLGSSIIYLNALPYILNYDSIHTRIKDNKEFFVYELNDGPTAVYLELETKDEFIATNPIDISIIFLSMTPSDPLIEASNLSDIKEIQLTFQGTTKYFPTKFQNLSILERKQKVSEIGNQSLAILEKKVSNYTGNTYFSGNIKNLTYNSGGFFDITVAWVEENVVGDELGNIQMEVIENAIYISSREVLLTIRNNHIMLGLAWLGIGLGFLIPSLNGLIKYSSMLFDYNLFTISKKDNTKKEETKPILKKKQ